MSTATTNQDIQAINAMYAKAVQAFEKGDLDTVLSYWEDDGVYLWPAIAPAIGKAAIKKAYKEFFDTWTATEIYHPHEIEVSGNLGYRHFSTEVTLTPKSGGPPTHMKLSGVHIFRRGPQGSWRFKIVIDINVP
jgi:uncharacterized protein (TIGR02246 family)